MGGFLEGHGDTLQRNRCVLGLAHPSNEHTDAIFKQSTLADIVFAKNSDVLRDESKVVGHFYGSCADSHLNFSSNEYYTPDGEVVIVCESDTHHTLKEMQDQFGLEVGSVGGMLPNESQILDWALAAVRLE